MNRKNNTNHEGLIPSFCRGNPLITSIPNLPLSTAARWAAIGNPGTVPDAALRKKERDFRLLELGGLKNVYIPTARDLAMGCELVTMLLQGYADRPPTAAHWENHQSECAKVAAPSMGRARGAATAITRAVMGISGSGKSTSVDNLLNRIKQVITHDNTKEENRHLPTHQIVWLKVNCPVNHTPRAFITEFFTQVDTLLGTKEWRGHSRENDEQLIVSMAAIARAHFLGFLVIDEIQNVVGRSKGADRRLMKLFVNIANILRVPILFLGTPRSQEVLNEELADSRRMLGQPWLPYQANNPQWKEFLGTLWQYQFTRTFTPLNRALQAKMHDLSQGVPGLAKDLFTLAQQRLILNSTPNSKEVIGCSVLQETFDQSMIPVHGAMDALRRGMALELYDDLLPKPVDLKRGVKNLNLADAEADANLTFKRKLNSVARKAAKRKGEEMFDKEAP